MAAGEFEEQHPIPTDIAGYQFRLVGDMTLKQFLQVAGGVLTGLVIYSLNIHPFVKWPLIIISVVFGIALAFMPLDDRPLSKWITVFFKSIYSPTIFVWKKPLKPYAFFKIEGVAPAAAPAVAPVTPVAVPGKPTPAQPAQPVAEKEEGIVYSSVDESVNKALTDLEKKEQSYLSKIAHLFTVPNLAGAAEKPIDTKPITFTYIPEEDPKKAKKKRSETPKDKKPSEVEDFTTTVSPILGKKAKISGKKVEFVSEASPPIPPSKDNVIVGQVTDHEGNIVEGAILEVKDENDRAVRALKTNRLGHFMIVTPLINGEYKIVTEKEGFEFEPVTFKAEGKIIPPMAIRGKNIEQTTDNKQN